LRTVHHVDDFTTQALIDCQRQAIIEPDGLIVVSEEWRKNLADAFGLDARVIYNGVNTAKLVRPADLDRARLRDSIGAGERFLFLTVGGIEPRKGTKEMIRALAEIKSTAEVPPMLAIIGGHSFQDHTPYRAAALDLADTLGISMTEDIVQLGTVTDRELAAWYHSADAFLFPSVKEGWGLVAMEAMAVGLPLIATDIPVFREYLSHGVDALLVPSGDHEVLAQQMQQLMSDPDMGLRLAEAAKRSVARFTWARAAEDHARAYAQALSER
jgi:glycosyltransferase involved in cell wall biosynthesis